MDLHTELFYNVRFEFCLCFDFSRNVKTKFLVKLALINWMLVEVPSSKKKKKKTLSLQNPRWCPDLETLKGSGDFLAKLL